MILTNLDRTWWKAKSNAYQVHGLLLEQALEWLGVEGDSLMSQYCFISYWLALSPIICLRWMADIPRQNVSGWFVHDSSADWIFFYLDCLGDDRMVCWSVCRVAFGRWVNTRSNKKENQATKTTSVLSDALDANRDSTITFALYTSIKFL